MHSRSPVLALRALVLGLFLAGLAGCTTIHSWAQGGAGQSPNAGASVSLPFGK
jgi:uncharacterized protein YceK